VSNLAFLLIVVVIALVGSAAVWLRNRKPTTFMSSVEDFQQEMKALGREPSPGGGGSRRSRASGKGPGGTRGAPPPGPSNPNRPAVDGGTGGVDGGPDEPPAGR
jgi:hypothetical protein